MKLWRLLAILLLALPAVAQIDPGPHGGTPDAGGPMASVAANNPFKILDSFLNAEARFKEINSVSGTIVGTPDGGSVCDLRVRRSDSCRLLPDARGSARSRGR